jgi:chromosome segregation ATPase
MSRVSDTRQRTREAAANLVAAGRRPHELTVDLIYAQIHQGSRTTINDELKLWKDEQTRAETLNAGLPPVLAQSMTQLWQLAIEHGEKAFDQRREQLEAEVAAAEAARQTEEQRVASQQQQIAQQESQLHALQQAVEAARIETASERSHKESALVRVQALENALSELRHEVAQQQALRQAEHEQQLQQLQQTMQAQEESFRAEIAQATERLESVQKHVMLQVAEARDARKQAESRLEKVEKQAEQKNAAQAAEIQELRSQLRLQTRDLEHLQTRYDNTSQQLVAREQQCQTLQQQCATASGKLEAWATQMTSLEQRARDAENRLAEHLEARLNAAISAAEQASAPDKSST